MVVVGGNGLMGGGGGVTDGWGHGYDVCVCIWWGDMVMQGVMLLGEGGGQYVNI